MLSLDLVFCFVLFPYSDSPTNVGWNIDNEFSLWLMFKWNLAFCDFATLGVLHVTPPCITIDLAAAREPTLVPIGEQHQAIDLASEVANQA